MGGRSATNACFALRGAPADYNRWADIGEEASGLAVVVRHIR